MTNDIGKIGSLPASTPETRKKTAEDTGSNAFSDVLSQVLADAQKIQDETAQSMQKVPNVGMDNIKVEMAKAGDAMQRIMQARENLLKAYKNIAS